MEPERAGARRTGLFVAFAATACFLALALPTEEATSLTLDAVGTIAVAAMVVAVWRAHLPRPAAWWLVTAGPICFLTGDLIWDLGWYWFGLPDDVLDVVPNLFYLLGYPFLALGLVTLARSADGRGDRAGLADGLIVAVAAAIPAWEFLVAPALADFDASSFDSFAAVAYPLLDVVVLGALVRVGVTARHRTASLWYLLAGVTVMLVADTVYFFVSLHAADWPVWLDVAWPLLYVLLAAAALHPSMREVATFGRRSSVILSRGRIVMVTAALLVAPITLVAAANPVEDFDFVVFSGLTGLLVVLVCWRILMLVRDAEAVHAAVEANERRFRSLVQHAADVIMVVRPDGRVGYVSPAITAVLGGSIADHLDRPLVELVHPSDQPAATQVLTSAIEGNEASQVLEARFRHVDGTWRSLEARVTPHLADPAVGGLVANLRDVTDRRVADDRRAAENRLLELIARGGRLEQTLGEMVEMVETAIPDVAISIRVLESADDAIGLRVAPHVIPAWVHAVDQLLLDREMPAAFTNESLHGPVIVENIAAYPETAAVLDRIPADSYHGGWVYPIRSADDDRLLGVLTCFVEDARGPSDADQETVERAVHTAAIAIERSSVHDRLMHLALHDALTGLPNRSLALDRLTHALRKRRHADSTVGVLFLDVDRFKVVNDSLGHDAGDELIVAVAQRLVGAMRPGDTVARFGGDEFVIVCEELSSAAEAEEIAERVAAALALPFRLPRGETIVSVSIGIALARRSTDTALGLLRDADAAMYQAKAHGRARHELFDDEMHTQALLRLRTERALRSALERDELRVVYQPQFDLRDQSIVGMEALVRWQHPHRGLIGPGEFVAIAEETGLILPIGEWVLTRACEAASRRGVAISVNLSGRQVVDAELPGTVARILRETGLPAGRLCLEVTESVLLQDEALTLAVLRELEALGVRLSIDDFGTGYSALAYLERYPFDELKIDQSFVAGLGDGAGSDPIVGATIEMAHGLGMTVVAEGVETERQLHHLERLRCDRAQGFLLAMPMDLDELDRLIASPARAS